MNKDDFYFEQELEAEAMVKRQARMLIIDYDVCRFHSFDLFRFILLDYEYFKRLKPEFAPFVQFKILDDQVDFYRSHCTSFNPFNHFNLEHPVTGEILCNYLVDILKHPKMKSVMTDITTRFDAAISALHANCTLLQLNNDLNRPTFFDQIETITTDIIFDPAFVSHLVIDMNINTIMVSSIEYAMILASYLIKMGYKIPIEWYIAKYYYNYEKIEIKGRKLPIIKCVNQMQQLHETLRYSFQLFDPFSTLTYKNKLLEQNGGNTE